MGSPCFWSISNGPFPLSMLGTTPPDLITDLLQWVSSSQIQNSDFLGLPISNCCDGGPHGLDCLTGFFRGLVLPRSPGFREFWVPNFCSGKPHAGVLFFIRRCRRHPDGPGLQRER